MGRAVGAAVVVLYFAALFALGGHSAWGKLGVPARSPTFLDLRSVTSGWECTRRGVPVLALNPCDPLRRPANYPTIWMKASRLGLGQGDTNALGIALAVLFVLAALVLLPREAGALEGAVYAGALCSPAVMLGVERGNADLLVFVVVVAAVLAVRTSRGGDALAAALLLSAAVLKLFPVFGFVSAVRRPGRRALVLAGAALALFAVYAYATRGDIRTIQRVIPQSRDYSYGIDLSGRWLGAHLPGSRHAWDAVLAFVALGAGAGAGLAAQGRRTAGGPDGAAYAYWVGAGIYVGTLLLAHNFDYRLAFLLLTLPQLLAWWRRGSGLAAATLAALGATVWLVHGRGLDVGAPAQLVLCSLLVAGLAASFAGGLAIRTPARGETA